MNARLTSQQNRFRLKLSFFIFPVVILVMFVGLLANIEFKSDAASGSLGRSNPKWFLGLAVFWLLSALPWAVLLLNTNISKPIKYCCCGTIIAIAIAAIVINLDAIVEILNVANQIQTSSSLA